MIRILRATVAVCALLVFSTCADSTPIAETAAPLEEATQARGFVLDRAHRLLGHPVAAGRAEADGWPPLRVQLAGATAIIGDPIVVDAAIDDQGERIAAVTPNGALLVGKARGAARRITDNAHPGLAFSPDGLRLAFVCGAMAPELDVCVADLVTGLSTRITSFDGPDDRPSFSEDGQTVFFVSGRTGVASIWSTAADGSTRPIQRTNRGVTSARDSTPVPVGPGGARALGGALVFDAGDRTVRITP